MNEEKKFLIKPHKSYRLVVAICDKDLAGQKLEEGEKQLDLTGQFFDGEEKNTDELLDLIRYYCGEDATFNIVGKNSCELALKSGLIEKEGIVEIKDVPYALVLL